MLEYLDFTKKNIVRRKMVNETYSYNLIENSRSRSYELIFAGKLSMSLQGLHCLPKTNSDADKQAAERAFQFFVRVPADICKARKSVLYITIRHCLYSSVGSPILFIVKPVIILK